MMKDKKNLRLLKEEYEEEQMYNQPEEVEDDLFQLFSRTFGRLPEEEPEIEEEPPDPQDGLRAAVERLSDQVERLEESIHSQQDDHAREEAAENCRQGRRSRAYGFLAGLGIALAGIPMLAGVITLGWKLLDWLSHVLEVSPTCLAAALVAVTLGAVMLKGSKALGNWWVDWTAADYEDEDEEV